MAKIMVLDCTLRDGGYCNQWEFGQQNIERINRGLVDAQIDVVETGFISNKSLGLKDITKYRYASDIIPFIPKDRNKTIFVAMMNYGEYDIDTLENRTQYGIDGIRLAFHKKDLKNALEVAKKIKDKGYLLFMQPMVSLSYSDEEFLKLIQNSNEINPFAFYIVDSFGVMRRKDLTRLFYMVEHGLKQEIAIGFHSHNNMQLAYSNAQVLAEIRTKHDLIIDSSVYGMGRGAGNLNTELFVGYLNDNLDTDYRIKPLLAIIDDILEGFYHRESWGYSLPNYLSASHNTHPNYARYLSEKHSLTFEEMDDILEMMDEEKRVYYDNSYIENLYLRYLSQGEVHEEHKEELIKNIEGKIVLLIAPGKSSTEEKEKICEFTNSPEVISVSINYNYPYINTDYIFVSNLRRFKEIEKDKKSKCIITSNIVADQVYLQTDYQVLLNSHNLVQDNAALMAIKFFNRCNANHICLAGMDGYSHDFNNNYGESRMAYVSRVAIFDEINKGMSAVLKEYSKEVKISFLTKERFVSIR